MEKEGERMREEVERYGGKERRGVRGRGAGGGTMEKGTERKGEYYR